MKLAQALPGFDHVSRAYHKEFDQVTARVLPGEYYVTQNKEVIMTILGSCVSACIRDPYVGIGGINHFMLPQSQTGQWSNTTVNEATRYGNFAMEHLINDILRFGGAKNGLEIKLFGGGKVLKTTTGVGERNIKFALNYLKAEGYRVLSSDLGGQHSRKIAFFPETGKVLMKILSQSDDQQIAKTETEYLGSISQEDNSGEIELF